MIVNSRKHPEPKIKPFLFSRPALVAGMIVLIASIGWGVHILIFNRNRLLDLIFSGIKSLVGWIF